MTRPDAGRIADEHAGLLIALECAVPLRILELARMSPRARARVIELDAARAADEVAHKGDVLQYGSRKRGEAAGVFNALARGLAAAAYQPGGITWAGQHWCVDHDLCRRVDLEVAARQADRDPDADAEPDDPGEWYGTRRVETVEIPGVSDALDPIPEWGG